MFLARNHKFAIFGVTLILALSIPLTALVLKQKQDIRQRASTLNTSVTSITITPVDSNSNTVTITATGNADFFDLYLHGTAQPSALDKYVSTYDPDTIDPHTFYYLGKTSATITLPSTPGTYSITANAESYAIPGMSIGGFYVCAWNDKLYYKNSGNPYTSLNLMQNLFMGCQNISPETLLASGGDTPSLTPPETPTADPTIDISPDISPTDVPSPTEEPSIEPSSTPTIALSPTSAPLPGDTLLNFKLKLHGIGSGGDNANSNGSGNQHPIHTQRPVTVEIYDSGNTLITTKSGAAVYATSTGDFAATVNLGPSFTTGSYIIKIKSDQYLRRQLPGFPTITGGQSNTLPVTSLVTGDINDDNQLNILDYNILVGCYSDLTPAQSCDSGKKAAADLTDDGKVNMFDYNLFLRELSIQFGN